ncbi:MAG: GNAT family N-acetyltransferase [bacterium]|nr:GNAT family N-acetyltransferase [bacterium]
MNFINHENKSIYIKIECEENGKIIGRAYLYLINNDLHNQPYALLEDMFVEVEARGRGIGKELMDKIIEEAKKNNCYKLVAQSRYSRTEAHSFYLRNGFKDHGKNFRIDI